MIKSGICWHVLMLNMCSVCTLMLPDAYSLLLTREADNHEWSLVHYDEINSQLALSEAHTVALFKLCVRLREALADFTLKDSAKLI